MSRSCFKKMIYDVLKSFEEHLLNTYSEETSNTYYKRLCSLFDGQNLLNTVKNLDTDKILYKLGQIKYKNHFSQSKNAFLHFCEFQNIELSGDVLENIKALEKSTVKKYKKLATIEYKEVDKTIKHIKNPKLKLCYQVLITTGLRVSELASITANDCVIDGDVITLSFIGKGGKTEAVTIIAEENPALFQRLKEHVKNTSSENADNVKRKVFYSAVYLQTKAKELGFKCHDLRRIFAKLEYKKHSKKEVMKKMRHSNIKTTNIYIRSKVKF